MIFRELFANVEVGVGDFLMDISSQPYQQAWKNGERTQGLEPNNRVHRFGRWLRTRGSRNLNALWREQKSHA